MEAKNHFGEKHHLPTIHLVRCPFNEIYIAWHLTCKLIYLGSSCYQFHSDKVNFANPNMLNNAHPKKNNLMKSLTLVTSWWAVKYDQFVHHKTVSNFTFSTMVFSVFQSLKIKELILFANFWYQILTSSKLLWKVFQVFFLWLRCQRGFSTWSKITFEVHPEPRGNTAALRGSAGWKLPSDLLASGRISSVSLGRCIIWFQWGGGQSVLCVCVHM